MEQNSQTGVPPACLDLLSRARQPASLPCVAIAGAIETARAHGLPPGRLLRGIAPAEFASLLDTLFPGAGTTLVPQLAGAIEPDDLDAEFDDVLQLLMEAAEPAQRQTRWLALAIASATLFDNHLWQDLRLPDRKALSSLLATHFGPLARRNTGNMRWKAFFYKQICDRSGAVCRSPSCGACDDYNECFGPE